MSFRWIAVVLGGWLLLAGCAVSGGSRPWADSLRPWPGWQRLGAAAGGALVEPASWLPAAGALLLQVDDWDARSAAWATRHHPLFDSGANAERLSDDLLRASAGVWLASGLAVPVGRDRAGWGNRLGGMTVQGGALVATAGTTLALKGLTGRERPDGDGDDSFPSAHSALAFAAASLSARNLAAAPTSPALRGLGQVGGYGLAALAGWARVEAGRHYPADILAGAALGHFLSATLHDAWLGDPHPPLQLSLAPARRGGLLALSGRF